MDTIKKSLFARSTQQQDVLDHKFLDATYAMIDKLMRLCQEKINLKRCPPYLIQILSAIHKHVRQIVVHTDNPDTLFRHKYFDIFVRNLHEKLAEAIKLFKDPEIINENSHARNRLTKWTLRFSHMQIELSNLYPLPDYKCVGNTFMVTKQKAGEWWKDKFHNEMIVSWENFFNSFSEHFNLYALNINENQPKIRLKETIDITLNDHVSIFEFDIFIRLFQPWDRIVEVWDKLVTHPGYMDFVTYDEVSNTLATYQSDPGAGTYVFRLSCTKLGSWAIGLITEDLSIIQSIPSNKSLAEALVDGASQGIYRYPKGQSINVDLSHLLRVAPEMEVLQTSKKQHEDYQEIGTSFEICQICSVKEKDTRLEPCGHLMCSECLAKWQKKHTPTSASYNQLPCPFCRVDIRDRVRIKIIPYQADLEDTNATILHGGHMVIDDPDVLDAADDTTFELSGSNVPCPAPSTKPSIRTRQSVRQQSSTTGDLINLDDTVSTCSSSSLPPPIPPPLIASASNRTGLPVVNDNDNGSVSSASSLNTNNSWVGTSASVGSALLLPVFIGKMEKEGYESRDIDKALCVVENDQHLAQRVLEAYCRRKSASARQVSSTSNLQSTSNGFVNGGGHLSNGGSSASNIVPVPPPPMSSQLSMSDSSSPGLYDTPGATPTTINAPFSFVPRKEPKPPGCSVPVQLPPPRQKKGV